MNLVEAEVTETGDAIVIGGQRVEISEAEAGGLHPLLRRPHGRRRSSA